jgi:hypothetical protein
LNPSLFSGISYLCPLAKSNESLPGQCRHHKAGRGSSAGHDALLPGGIAVREADWILVLDGGAIVEQGTHQDLVAANGRYWQLLSRQQLEEEIETGEHPVKAYP